MGELVVRLVFSLAVVLGLLLLIAKFAGRRFQGRKDAVVQVVHRQQLSRNAAISVVHVGGRVLVLGTTDQEVRLLTELDPESEAVAELESTPTTVEPAGDDAVDNDLDTADDDLADDLVDDELTDAEIAALTAPPAPAEPAMTSESLAELLSAVATGSTPTPLPAAPAPPTAEPYVGRRIARPVEPLVAAPVISPAAELLAFEIVAERRTEPTLPVAVPAAVPAAAPAAAPAARAVKPPSKAALRAATKRLDKQLQKQLAERAASAPASFDDGRLAGSVLSGQTWKQAWHAVRGQAS